MCLAQTKALLEAMSDPCCPNNDFLAEAFSIRHDWGQEYRIWVRFWNTTDRVQGLCWMFSRIFADGFEVKAQAENILWLSEVELVVVPRTPCDD